MNVHLSSQVSQSLAVNANTSPNHVSWVAWPNTSDLVDYRYIHSTCLWSRDWNSLSNGMWTSEPVLDPQGWLVSVVSPFLMWIARIRKKIVYVLSFFFTRIFPPPCLLSSPCHLTLVFLFRTFPSHPLLCRTPIMKGIWENRENINRKILYLAEDNLMVSKLQPGRSGYLFTFKAVLSNPI